MNECIIRNAIHRVKHVSYSQTHTHTHTRARAYLVQNFQYYTSWLVRLCAKVHLWALTFSVLKYHWKK